jgi:hypothetical protein
VVKVEHQEARGTHELGAARALLLYALFAASVEILSILVTIHHPHIGQCRQVYLGAAIATAVQSDELLGLGRVDDVAELLCIARLQALVVGVVYIIDHTFIFYLRL